MAQRTRCKKIRSVTGLDPSLPPRAQQRRGGGEKSVCSRYLVEILYEALFIIDDATIPDSRRLLHVEVVHGVP